MKPLRIAMVVPGGVDRSGTERVIPALLWQIERLARQHELHVFALHQYAEPCTYPLLGATIHNLGWPRGKGSLGHMPCLVALMRQQGRWDVVHGLWGFPATCAAALAGRILRTPSVTTLVGGELIALPDIGYGGRLSLAGRLFTQLTLRLTHHITVLSAALQTEAHQLGFASTWLPLGVDGACFVPDIKQQANNPRLLHVASLNAIKDQTLLLHAMQRVVASRPEVCLDVIGEDTLGGAMQTLAQALGLAANVVFHGFLPSHAARPFWQQAQLFVLSSRHEGQCVAVVEAAAAGLPTVGTRVGLVAEWAPTLAHAVPVGDANALAEGILHLLSQETLRKTMGEAARAWAHSHDADWTAKQFQNIYERLVMHSANTLTP